MLAELCIVLGGLLLVPAFVWIAVGYYQTWLTEGFQGLNRLLSPYNIYNLIMTLLVLAPGVGLIALGEKIRKGGISYDD